MVRFCCWCAMTLADGARWQDEAASWVERHFRDTSLMPRLHDTEKALLRSQSGPLSGAALSTVPTCFHTRIDSHLFRLLLLRHLRLPLPPCVPVCRCGSPLDSLATIEQRVHGQGLLARRGFAVEMAAARCAGDLDHIQHWTVEDLRLWQKAFLSLGRGAARPGHQVSEVRADGTARPGAAQRDGVALVSARRPELVRRGARTRLVVFAGDVGGRLISCACWPQRKLDQSHPSS